MREQEKGSKQETAGKKHYGPQQEWMDDGRYQAILRQNRTIAFEFNPQSGRQFVSPFISDFLAGKYDERLLSQVMLEDGVLHPKDMERMMVFRDKMRDFQGSESIQMRLKTVNGDFRWHRMAVCSYLDKESGSAVIMGTITDTDEEMRLRERQRHLAEFDEITGIYNKFAFFQSVTRCMQEQSGRTYQMVIFDIDRFKLVNDLFGVPEGDRLLRFLGSQVSSLVKEGEPYGRIRDDLFGMFLARTDMETTNVLKKLVRELEGYSLNCRLSLSAGICSVMPGQETPVNILCDRAMLALKRVKGSAVEHFAFYRDKLGTEVIQEQELIGDMHRGISNGQFEVWFQPKNDLKNGNVVGAEALVRWRHPRKGLLLPGAFLPVFERNGLIASLDEYVWEETARTLREWLDAGYQPFPVSVNVSRIHLYDPQLVDRFVNLMKRYQLPPRLFEIELTESAYVEHPHLGELMERLQQEGFTFLMDDFGSGYSSLNMLRSIPVDILKLDLHFLGGREEAAKIILESVILMAKRLSIPVIAEGVETREQADFLIEAGCGTGQGFLYSKPIPAEEFVRRFLISGGMAPAGPEI